MVEGYYKKALLKITVQTEQSTELIQSTFEEINCLFKNTVHKFLLAINNALSYRVQQFKRIIICCTS